MKKTAKKTEEKKKFGGKQEGAGRPPKFTDEELMQQKIDEYFQKCDTRVVEKFIAKTGDVITVNEPEPYTMSGLAYHLDMDRRSLLNYSEKERFFRTVKKAREKVQLDVERRLMTSNPAGAIFNLKNNFGWVDKQEIDNKYSEGAPTVKFELSDSQSSYADFLKQKNARKDKDNNKPNP